MDDEADVFLIDAHAKGRGRNDDIVTGFIVDPFLLALFTLLFREAGVVGNCANFVGTEANGEGITVGAEDCVDDTGDGVRAFGFCIEFRYTGGVVGASMVHFLQPGGELSKANIIRVRGEAYFVV